MQRFEKNGVLFAIVVKKNEIPHGTHFVTKNEDDLQVGTWKYEKGKVLNAHYHVENKREIKKTQEFIFIKSGIIKCTIFDLDKNVIGITHLREGDFAVFQDGGHGYEFLRDGEVVEVKCGMFNFDDKVRI